MTIRSAAAAFTLALLASGCTGAIGEPDPTAAPAPVAPVPGRRAPDESTPPPKPGQAAQPGQAATPVFSCDRSMSPDELPLPRLSRTELENTLRFAITQALPDAATAIWSAVAPTFEGYPADQRTPAPGDLRGGYSRADQAIQQTQVDAMYATGVAIAQELTVSPARLAAMMGSCATDASTSNDRACLESFVARWGGRVMRHPLRPDDVAYYADMAGSSPVAAGAVADVITAILDGPEVLYRVEHGTDDARDPAPLSAFELAARLSYQFWQMPPDDELWAAAQTGALLEVAALQSQSRRLLASKNARGVLDEFFTQWLRLDELPPLDALKANPIFKAFAGAQMPPSNGHRAMIEDVLSSAYATVTSGRSVSDFLNDRHSYATDAFLAGIYQVGPWTAGGPPPLVSSPARAGLLTRAAVLATGTALTRPIHKGYLVRNALLCQQVGQPPPDVDTTPPPATGGLSTRQTVAALTSSGTCGGCHTTLINPPGFASENFDALGRERTQEKLFDDRGNVTATLPVNTAAIPMVVPGDARELRDAVELTRVIDESRLFHSCVARQYFRFTQRRTETAAKDGCLLSALESAARSGAPMAQVLTAVALDPAFRTRRFP